MILLGIYQYTSQYYEIFNFLLWKLKNFFDYLVCF